MPDIVANEEAPINQEIRPIQRKTYTRRALKTKYQGVIHVAHEKLEEANKKLAKDPLTGLGAKSLFEETLSQEIANVDRDRRSFPLELTIMDIDNFGAFNKQYDQATGDEVLKTVGATINNTLRASDLAFRIGGEELAVVSRRTYNPEKAGEKLVSERHIEAIRNARSLHGHGVTVSAGQAGYIRGENMEAFVNRANTAMNIAKRLGKNRVVVGEVIDGKEVYKDKTTGNKYNVTKDEKGKILEVNLINPNG